MDGIRGTGSRPRKRGYWTVIPENAETVFEVQIVIPANAGIHVGRSAICQLPSGERF